MRQTGMKRLPVLSPWLDGSLGQDVPFESNENKILVV